MSALDILFIKIIKTICDNTLITSYAEDYESTSQGLLFFSYMAESYHYNHGSTTRSLIKEVKEISLKFQSNVL